jgi:hypothetical protein
MSSHDSGNIFGQGVHLVLETELVEKYIATFAGYGDVAAPYWFIGMEEGGDSSDESLEQRLHVWRERGGSAIEDLYEYHIETGLAVYVGSYPKLQTTWKQLIRILLTAEDRDADSDSIRTYQGEALGRRGGETALLELYPLPAVGLAHWPYGELTSLPYLRDRKTYLRTLEAKRIRLLQRMIDEHQPSVVIMYGTTYREQWERLHGSWLRAEAEPELFRGSRGHSELLLIKHPAAKGATNDYFKSVGDYIRLLRAAS